MKAFILVQVPVSKSAEVVATLRRLPGVSEAWAVYGETDIIAKVEAPDNQSLGQLVMREIQGIKLVNATRTLIVIESV